MTDNGLAALAAALDPRGFHDPETDDFVMRGTANEIAAAILGPRGVFLPDGLPDGFVQVGALFDAERTIKTLTRERDLAVAHDRQPCPTAHAYERVCRVRDQQTAAIATLRAALDSESMERADAERILDLNAADIRDRDEALVMVRAAVVKQRDEITTLRAAIQFVLDDAESQHPGGWGPDVTMVAVLQDALATAKEAAP